MERGIIYLIQPPHLIGTMRYKFGICGVHNFNTHMSSYDNETRLISLYEVPEPKIIDGVILRRFRELFRSIIVNGKYFEGDEKKLVKEFNKLVLDHIIKYNKGN